MWYLWFSICDFKSEWMTEWLREMDIFWFSNRYCWPIRPIHCFGDNFFVLLVCYFIENYKEQYNNTLPHRKSKAEKMSYDTSRVSEYLSRIETLAEDILSDKHSMTELDRRRNKNREAIRHLINEEKEKSASKQVTTSMMLAKWVWRRRS